MSLPACLYLHGFLSSPQSLKAQQVHDYYRQHGCPERLSVPQLPFEPQHAIDTAEQELQRLMSLYRPNAGARDLPLLIIGSSLGGFYATWLAQHYDVHAALINPAVRPYELLDDYLGPNTHYHTGEVHELTHDHIAQLQQLYCPTVSDPQRLMLLLQTGDETLDYRLAADYYRNCPAWLEGGGDHSFQHFEQRLSMLMQFASR